MSASVVYSQFGCINDGSLAVYRKKDAVDIDKFVEYEKFTKKILEEGPSRLMVYLNLEDVKASWKVCQAEQLFMFGVY